MMCFKSSKPAPQATPTPKLVIPPDRKSDEAQRFQDVRQSAAPANAGSVSLDGGDAGAGSLDPKRKTTLGSTGAV